MPMTEYDGNVEIITNIGTTPDERGLSTDEFKAKFDEGLKAFVTWFNSTHKTEFDEQAGIDALNEHINDDTAHNINEKANISQENWINVIGQNNWAQTSNPPLSYYKDTIGIVHLWGQIQNGTATNGTVIATLPEGYRPANTVRNTAVKTNDGSIFSIGIATTGDIAIYGLSTTGTIAINCSFRAT